MTILINLTSMKITVSLSVKLLHRVKNKFNLIISFTNKMFKILIGFN
jgi:hypothetical protein